jgi:hypothetical protein
VARLAVLQQAARRAAQLGVPPAARLGARVAQVLLSARHVAHRV